MTTPTPEQLAKLPKWVQEHIKSVTRDRDTWKSSALRFSSEQEESPFYSPEFSTEGIKKRYIATENRRVIVEYAGIHAEIFLACKDDGQRLHGIEIGFSAMSHSLSACTVALIPRGFNSFQLVHKDNLR